MMPLGVHPGAPVVSGLSSPIGKPWLQAMYDSAEAASITLNGSNVAQWDDLSGAGRHATQADAGEQPPYFASDPRAAGRPAIGPSVRDGKIGLVTPSMGARRLYYCGAFADGVLAAFDQYNAIFYGNGDTNGTYRIIGRVGNNDLFSNSTTFAATARKNGAAAASVVLPLPTSILVITAPAIRVQTFSICHADIFNGRVFQGPLEHFGLSDGTETDAERDDYEGWLAQGRGITLDPSHPHAS